MTHTKTQNTPQKTPMAAMHKALENAMLSAPIHGQQGEADMLHQQAETLNAMFHATLSQSFGTQYFHREDAPHYISEGRVALALRIQQQCAATIKAKSAIEYMEALSYTVTPPAFRAPDKHLPLPAPVKHDEQKEDGA